MSCAFVLSASPAWAALQRPNTLNFGTDGTNATSFTEVSAAAFDQTQKRLYVTNITTPMYGFNASTPGTYTPLGAPFPVVMTSSGTAASTGGLAVDNSGLASEGDIYRASGNGSLLFGYTPAGAARPSPFNITVPSPVSLCGVAVDSGGNVWLGNNNATGVAEGRGLLRYTSAGTALTPISTSAAGIPGTPCRLAFDSNDDLYIATGGTTGQVWKLTAASSYATATMLDPDPANGVAVNKVTHHVFVAHKERVDEYDNTGTLIREFGNGFGVSANTNFLGVAVNQSTDEVYVTDNGTGLKKVKVFGPPAVIHPDVTTSPATAVTRNSATANGVVDPSGGTNVTECKVQYGTSRSYGSTVSCVPTASVGTPYTSSTAVTASLSALTPGTTYHFRVVATNSEGTNVGLDQAFTTIPAVKETITGAATAVTQNSATLNGSFNADSISTTYYFEYGPQSTACPCANKIPLPAPPGANGGSAASSTPVSVNVTGLTPGTTPTGTLYNYRIAAVNSFGTTFGASKTFVTLPAVKALATLPATNIKAHSVKFNGTFDPNGIATKYYFEYGTTIAYGSYAPLSPPGESGGETTGPKEVSTVVSGLEAGVTYNYRLVATNIYGTTQGLNQTFIPNEEPTITFDVATQVNTDGALLGATINPNALATTYHFEYGNEDCSVTVCEMGPSIGIGAGKEDVPVKLAIAGFLPSTIHHFRVVATNSRGTTTGADHFFKTFPLESGVDNCPNVLVRKQTGAGVAPKCRGYELVSAVDSGGYDVESNLIPGLHPLPGYPRADGKVAYTVRYGAIPGSGDPTNRGGDPYVATRGNGGWTTEYVGLQADGTPSLLPFSSTLAGADDRLTTFAFAGPEVCSPCFSDGSTNIPLRLPDGSLTEGMVGSEDPGPVDPSGEIAKRLSADGSHFIFGTTSKLESAGNEGSLTIYDRNLHGGGTQVVSTLPNGSTMTGSGIEELDVSEDGSRILIGKLVGTDAAGNKSYDLYMHVGSNSHSVEVANTVNGVVYAGMNADGTKVYFTTPDQLAGDGDASVDLFRADVGPGSASVTRVSTGIESTGDGNSCNPVANSAGNHWNAVGNASPASCGVVAIAGGGGVASTDGTVFFLSPEKLDGSAHGTLNQPNLYVAKPGSAPNYVTTLDPDNALIRHGVANSEVRDSSDLQVTPDGRFAVFATNLALTGASTSGHIEIYRYDSSPGGGLICASCAPTNGAPSTDTSLTSGGLNISDDGRVFFTSAEQLVLRDTNQLKDVYEWDANSIGLVTTGLDTNDSGLLTVTADGKDVYFFTRQSLAPQDQNGGAMKIYDAREGGGFLYNPPPQACLASDECHGPGTQAAPEPSINTVRGTEEAQPAQQSSPAKVCKRGFVKSRGRCVKRHQRHTHHPTRRRHG